MIHQSLMLSFWILLSEKKKFPCIKSIECKILPWLKRKKRKNRDGSDIRKPKKTRVSDRVPKIRNPGFRFRIGYLISETWVSDFGSGTRNSKPGFQISNQVPEIQTRISDIGYACTTFDDFSKWRGAAELWKIFKCGKYLAKKEEKSNSICLT